MIQGAVDQKPVWDISGAPETLSKGFSLGISVWRVTLCLLGHHNPGTPLPAPGGRRQWDKRLSQEVLLACSFGEQTGTFWNKGWKLRGQWGFHSSLSLAPKPGKNSVSSSLHTSTNPFQILGSHPDTAQRDIIPQQGMMLWGFTGLPCNFHCSHPGLPFLLPLNCLLLQAENQRRINSDLSHFSC